MRVRHLMEERLDLADWFIMLTKPDPRLIRNLPNDALEELMLRTWRLRAIFAEEMLRRCMEKLKRYERGVMGGHG